MNKGIVQQTHQDVFNWLYDWNKRVRKSATNDEPVANPFFYLRTREDARFKKGFWFPGTEKYMCISFWTGGDTKNLTPNVYLEFHRSKGIRILLIGRDSDKKQAYFAKLASHLGDCEEISKGVFIKVLQANSTENYLYWLNHFVENEKILIDAFLTKTLARINEEDYHLLQDEYSSKFGFLSVSQFDTLVANVLRQREILIAPADILGEVAIDPYNYRFQRNDFIDIISFSIGKYKSIGNCTILPIPKFVNWIFITGENGFGKTCILQAIALGLTDYPENIQHYLSKSISGVESVPDIQIDFRYGKQKLSNFLSAVKSSTFTRLNNYFIAYGANRLLTQKEETENLDLSENTSISSLFKGIGELKNIDYEARKYFYTGKERFKRFKRLIHDATNGRIADIQVKDYVVSYIEKTSDGNLPPVPYDSLATGFKNVLNIVADIYVRFSEYQKTIDPARFKGIVCIDELENHLHAKFQVELPGLLSKVFPEIQFIATTHSPLPIIGAPEKYALIKVTRTVADGIKTERLDDRIDFRNLLPNALFTSPAFDLENLVVTKDPDFTKLGLENSYNEKVFYDILENKLNEYAKEKGIKMKKTNKKPDEKS